MLQAFWHSFLILEGNESPYQNILSKWKKVSHSVMSDSLWSHGLYSQWDSPGQNTGVGGLSLLQGIVPTQGSNPGLPHHRRILYQLSHQGSLRILEWVAYPSSRGSSHPRNRTMVSCIAGRFFTSWANREAQTFKATFKMIRISPEEHSQVGGHILFLTWICMFMLQ